MDVRIREATHDDYEAVMAIRNNLFDGHDYLISTYHILLDKPGTRAYLGEYKGEVILFAMGLLLDDGHTVLGRATRIKQEFEKKGLLQPVIKMYRSMSGADNEARAINSSNLKIVSYSSYDLVLRCDFSDFSLRTSDVKSILSKKSNFDPELTTIDRNLLKRIFSNNSLCSSLFPENRLMLSWVPYRPMQANVDLIMAHNALILADPDAFSDTQHAKSCLMTLGGAYQCKNKLLYYIDIAGTDTSYLVSHIAAHLRHVALTVNRWSV